MTTAGLQPQAPAAIKNQLIAQVAATSPGYTASLPGILIEDISSTDVAAIVLMDSFRVELLNSISPYGANAFLLNELGQQVYGVQKAAATVTSVSVVFNGPPGYVIPVGFLVSDGIYQYAVQDGAIIGSGGASLPTTCFATVPGSWVILAGTVTQLVTSIPVGFSITVSNPLPGTPAIAAEDESDYRVRVLQAGLAASQGMPRYLKTLVGNVPGVQTRLISVIQQTTGEGGWEVLVGGGDIYQVAFAIFQSMLDVSTLVGSSMTISNITNANPGVITTVLNHGYANGQIALAQGVLGMYQINNVSLTVTVIDEKNFSCGVNTSMFSTYTSGGVLTPNVRNNYVTIVDYPDTYQVVFVNPPQQTVAISVTYNTSALNFTSGGAVAQLGNPALVNYVNAVPVGQPMNLFELQTEFQEAISSVLSPALLTRMVFAVSVNGVGVAPSTGTGIIAGDPESYFLTNSSLVTIGQG
jgi:hypothetical protein